MTRVAINGYGRIGRIAHRIILERFIKELDIIAINAGSSTDIEGWMYLLKYDSVYGTLTHHSLSVKTPEQKPLGIDVSASFIGWLVVDGKEIPVFSEKDPSSLPWKEFQVDVVIESTGALTHDEDLKKHISSGARSVILSAPLKEGSSFPTYVLGVNLEQGSKKGLETIISNASCTTNCVAPVAAVIEEHLGIENAMMTTVHGYTSDQRLHDGGHKDYRRSRAAALNIVPTSTGATQAAALTIPALKDKFVGLSLRVPVPVGSLSDFTFVVKKETTAEEVMKLFEDASKSPRFQHILAVTHDPIVSTDVIGQTYSAIVDLSLTQVVGKTLVKVIAWYDNEYGYANRLVEEIVILGKNANQ